VEACRRSRAGAAFNTSDGLVQIARMACPRRTRDPW